ncbi:PREDICTED: probable protein phosphatase 2C 28 isoform X1 [Nicotiana attenuata]|uniref:probable protein phosphatase 2C 28 isoform X1 n=1 Tax=Nicotiana attenuata TaxID=49451 RepID=UPI0009057AB0|nr:PREDICTED: probable protein phosphatase 2C 28 isoform X1 [Nicotiana attenuata]
MLGFLRIFPVRRTAASMKATPHFPASLLFAFNQACYLRGKSGDQDIIKIKRTSTPDDVASVLLKERERQGVYGAGRDVNSTAEREEDDAENEDYNGDYIGAKDEDNSEVVNDPEEDGGDVEVSNEDQKQQRRVSCGFYLVEGKMKHGMEDYLVVENRKMDGHNLGLYAIFDGHSGREVAEYLQSHLFDNILSEPDFWKNPVTAFKKAYRDTDSDILENVVGARGGSTAVTAILIDQKLLVMANVGDSRAILIQRGKVKQITVDHEPEKKEERDLVESKGGFVIKRPGNVPRVDGQLAMTRAFGDAKVKDHITVEPNVTIEKIDKDTDSIILASDGLWKVMSNEEVAECIRGIEHCNKAAEELITESLMRGSPDDISCVVVMFH